jgi:hypothetical protein
MLKMQKKLENPSSLCREVVVIRILPGLGQRSVVPDVPVTGKGVGHVPELPAFLVEILKSESFCKY